MSKKSDFVYSARYFNYEQWSGKKKKKIDVYTHVSKVITQRISARLLWFVSWLALHVWVSKIEPLSVFLL